MYKNIIFLDIDGVLNNSFTIYNTGSNMEEGCVRIFYQTICQIPDVKIVISSSWRSDNIELFFHRCKQLNCYDRFEPLIPYLHEDHSTKRLQDSFRGLEIREWLNRHSEVEKYICLDDDSDYFKDQKLLQTNRNIGFSREEQCLLLTYFGVKSLDDRDYGITSQKCFIEYGMKILKNRLNFINKNLGG